MNKQSGNKYHHGPTNYDKYPFVRVTDDNNTCLVGWKSIGLRLVEALSEIRGPLRILTVETYQGVLHEDVVDHFTRVIKPDLIIDSRDILLPENQIKNITERFLTDDPVFGFMTDLKMSDLIDNEKCRVFQEKISLLKQGTVLVFGPGASVVQSGDVLVYADMARWEIQRRMRLNLVDNLGVRNREERIQVLYKRGYFVDWRICDQLKKELYPKWDFVLDTNAPAEPKLVASEIVRQGLEIAASEPFRVVPFFDPGPWGGQWMKEICDLDREAINFAWCFDCVPEENSLVLGIGEHRFELPSINLVFFKPKELLGEHVLREFGAEFPIRFDFLDTMDGGNLSLQVHPLKNYIKDKFGMSYTQDESYYILDAREGAHVFLGLKDDVHPDQMIAELKSAQNGGPAFQVENHVAKWSVKKHDHVLIPSGTVHCSGKDSMVLEISATPYIFTFKLWDWGRLGLDGKPRPIHIDHGKEAIQWDRTESWTQSQLVNPVEQIAQGDGWREERTGLHELEYIETRRHWFTKTVLHNTDGNLNVLNLIEGREAIIESPSNAFTPYVVHYAETFIIPAAIGEYSITPHGASKGSECGTIKAYVRTSTELKK
ncbi:MAG: mannose-6-phosphate isomerase [Bacteroidetes bacterium]|nr:MAG: mannose-6-phosphate isomerase [Bacteroidota bacterium]